MKAAQIKQSPRNPSQATSTIKSTAAAFAPNKSSNPKLESTLQKLTKLSNIKIAVVRPKNEFPPPKISNEISDKVQKVLDNLHKLGNLKINKIPSSNAVPPTSNEKTLIAKKKTYNEIVPLDYPGHKSDHNYVLTTAPIGDSIKKSIEFVKKSTPASITNNIDLTRDTENFTNNDDDKNIFKVPNSVLIKKSIEPVPNAPPPLFTDNRNKRKTLEIPRNSTKIKRKCPNNYSADDNENDNKQLKYSNSLLEIEEDKNTKISSTPVCYKCKKCFITFDNYDDFQFHIGLQHENNYDDNSGDDNEHVSTNELMKDCEICGESFKNDELKLKIHMQQEHNSTITDDNSYDYNDDDAEIGTISMECGFCSEKFMYHRNLVDHIDSIHSGGIFIDQTDDTNNCDDDDDDFNHVCKICGKFFSSSEILSKHTDRAHYTEDIFDKLPDDKEDCSNKNCKICGPSYDKKISPLNINLLGCRLCISAYSTRKLLDTHYRNEHISFVNQEIQKSCEICMKLFTSKQIREKHEMDTHFNSKTNRYDCDKIECSFSGICISDIVNHNRKVHKIWKCYVCQINARSDDHWLTHLIRHTASKLPIQKSKQTNKLPSNTNQSTTSIESADNVDPNERILIKNRRELDCIMCMATIKGQKALMQHERKEHFNNETDCYCCTLCEFQAKHRFQIRDHMTDEHNRTDPFICDQCGLLFNSKMKLHTHIRKHFMQETRQLTCKICGKCFKDKNKVIRHEKYHTDDRPFKCNLCEKTYKDLTDLRRHKRIHGIGELKISCNLCDEKFYEGKQLRHHQRKRHAIIVK